MKKFLSLMALAIIACSCANSNKRDDSPSNQEEEKPLYGFRTEDYASETIKVKNGETFSGLFNRLGLSTSEAYLLSQRCGENFDVRKLRAGAELSVYRDTVSGENQLRYVIYNHNVVHSTVFQCYDSLQVWNIDKPVESVVSSADVVISSSLWNDLSEAGASHLLILELSDIYAWTVDFFSLQKGDRFRVDYTQQICEDKVIGIENVSFAVFSRGERNEYAIYYDQGDGGNKYWNEKGESMRKAFLKAPLQFKRISSGFSYHRKHPVTGQVKAHTGVDYAAPAGTPVVALGDGTVLSANWQGGGGNTIKIRHNSVYTTGYLHLKGFAKGIKAGARVSQGQVIGYVGSTGTSTGPHLDFRVWKNGSPINPLTMESPSAEPINESNKPALDSLFRDGKNRWNIE